jgi:hypothetical protein
LSLDVLGALGVVSAGVGVEAEVSCGGVAGRPKWRRMMIKARMRISAPQSGQSCGKSS